MKTCCHCKQEKSDDSFSWRNKSAGTTARDCKECHRLVRRLYYRGKSDKEKAAVIARRNSLRNWIKEIKLNLSCVRCGFNHPAALDFHHEGKKEKEISIMASQHGMSRKRILEEMSKCEVLCSNCHRIHHYGSFFASVAQR